IDRHLAPGGESSILATSGALAVRDAPDQATQLELFAASMAAVSTVVRPILKVLRSAAAVDPDLAAVHAEMEGYRLAHMTAVAGWLAARSPLRVPTRQAGEIIWAIAGPDVARLLCDRPGWTESQHADWIRDTLTRT